MRTVRKWCLGFFSLALSISSFAYEPESFFAEYQKQNAVPWKKQNREIDKRLKALEKKYGKKPNIIYILADDIGWGELGSYGGGKVRGTPTPNLDNLATQGMKFLSFYSEPACTPTRAALMTGRLPVRSSMNDVLFPGQTIGLKSEEYTLAELLSDSGYHTAMFGKWHLGEGNEHQPTNQGFDYAFYTLYNGAIWPWAENARYYDPENETIAEVPYQLDTPKDFVAEYGIEIFGILESRKGQIPREVAPLSLERYNVHDDELTDKIIDYIEEKSDSDKPFFVYYATNANQVFACPPEHRNDKHVDSGNCQASQLAQHDENVKRITDKLSELEIEENTLLVWMSDNGPMYVFFPSSGYSWLRGKKGDTYEGGIRVPAMAYWPGVIEAGQDPMDMVHVTDWYTVAARIAGGMDNIPNDRVTDGIDQSALLLFGEDAGRRNYMFHYGRPFSNAGASSQLGAVRYGDIKIHPGKMEIYNIIRDPGEKRAVETFSYMWSKVPFFQLVAKHKKQMVKFPNVVQRDGSEPPRLDVKRLNAE